MSLGAPYPGTSLAEARALHSVEYAKVKKGNIDPLAERAVKEAAVAAEAAKPTFGAVCDDYIKAHADSWSAKHAYQWRQTLGVYCKPIRDLPVDQIDTKAVRSVLEPIWRRVPTTAAALKSRIETIISAAQAAGHIEENRANPARWKGHLEHWLPSVKKIGNPGHRAAMPYGGVPVFWRMLMASPDTAPRALAFAILTAMRTSEVTGMTWDEVDIDHLTTWSVPGPRMKMRKPHEVPLSDAAAVILKQQLETRGKSRFVFPGALPAKPLSENALARAMKRLGGRDTVHGFRSSFRSWCADQGVAFEVAEQCLSHTVGNSVVQAYQRSNMLERRRPVMQAWANFVDEQAADRVVPFKRA
jgi:integrase